MKIDFNEMVEAPMPNFKGGEGRMMARIAQAGQDKVMCNRLEPGCSIGMHCHEDSSEVIFITSGSGVAICDGVEEVLGPGQATFCPKGSSHTLRNAGDTDLCFYAFVPHLG